jgi:hypothetical protein
MGAEIVTGDPAVWADAMAAQGMAMRRRSPEAFMKSLDAI